MKQLRIDVINEWLILKSAKNIFVFLEFANFYRRFIRKFFQIVAFLTNLIADAKKSEIKSIFIWNAETQKTFFNLKTAFINALILQHYDWNVALQMKIDVFNRDVEDVFNQRNNNKQWHLIAFMNYKFKETEKWWNTHDKELYAIILKFKNWRYYLQNSKHLIRVIINYNNFRYFMSTKKLSAKQIRWTEKLTAFDFIIEYRRKKLNLANALSRRFNIMKLDDSENNNDDFLFILRHKFCNSKCQSKQEQIRDEFTNIKLTALTAQLNNTFIANIWITRLNEKVLARRRDILNSASFRLFVQRIAKSKRFYLNLKKLMIAWLRQLQQKNAFVIKK